MTALSVTETVFALVLRYGPATADELHQYTPSISIHHLRNTLLRLRRRGRLSYAPGAVPRRGASAGTYTAIVVPVLDDSPLEDDGWTPPVWVHPYARRAA